MKKLSLIIIALCTCATFYCERDTNSEIEGRRVLEPRLSNDTEWKPYRAGDASAQVADQHCLTIADADTARDALSAWPECLDDAITVLAEWAPRDAKATINYAAALYLRAQRDKHRPQDFLEALRHSKVAIEAEPTSASALFNHALILEALGARNAAIEAWTEFLPVAEGGWRREANERLGRLRAHVSDAERWESEQPVLAAALRARDSKKIEQIIKPFPSAAFRHFEENLLLQWAQNPTDENLGQLSVFAAALSRRLDGDPLPTDTVDAIVRAKGSPKKWNALREGHRRFALARMAQGNSQNAPFAESIELLTRGDSPFRFAARVRNSELIAEELENRGYWYYAAVAHWNAAHELQQTRFLDARDEYEKAREIFESTQDRESLTAIHSRKIGLYRYLGDRPAEWRHAFESQRDVDRLIYPRYRLAHYLELAAAARRWNRYDLALFYLDQRVSDLKAAKQPNFILLAFALAHRAQAALDAGSVEIAEHDVAELEAIPEPKDIDSVVQLGLKARKAEVHGQLLLAQKNPTRAIERFTTAIDNTAREETTLHVSRLARRAEAHLVAQQEPEAKADLEEAVAILLREGQSMFDQRADAKEVLNPYFDRFQSTYRELIKIYMDNRDFAGAFAYAELARAAEPLNLVGGRPTTVNELLAKLPPRTYILEYCVFERETVYWLIGDGKFWVARKRVSRSMVERWRDDFYAARYDGRIADMHIPLAAAHAQLIAPALKHIPPDSRIVVVADGALHALPFAAMHLNKEYLVKTAPIEYSGSAALYLAALKRDDLIPPTPNPSVLAVGNPTFDPALPAAQGLPELPEAEGEARDILLNYPRADLLVRNEATVPRFSSSAPNYDIIHIAAHAVVNPDEPARSAILFAPSPGHAGALEPGEIQQLLLHKTRLMVLSACETGGGLPIGSEGVAPLVRPALVAGVPGVIATQWDVDDATTRKLMVSLHAEYKAGRDAAIALRNAQLAAIKKQISVKDWAAFQVIGHASSPFASRPPDSGGTSNGIHSSHSLQRSDRLRSQ